MTNEPVAIGTAVTGLVTAGLALLVAFGVALTQVQQTAILGFIAALILLVGILVRARVTPVTKVDEVVEARVVAEVKAQQDAYIAQIANDVP